MEQAKSQLATIAFSEYRGDDFFATGRYTNAGAGRRVGIGTTTRGIFAWGAMFTYVISDLLWTLGDGQVFDAGVCVAFDDASDVTYSDRYFGWTIKITFRGEAIRGYAKMTFIDVACGVFLIDLVKDDGEPFGTNQRSTTTAATGTKVECNLSGLVEDRFNRCLAWDYVAIRYSVFFGTFKIGGATIAGGGAIL